MSYNFINRKLQSEIDKVLKKVEEGVELFDDITEKVYTAGQQSLKEKYEGDLKKEIKKLQRLRDQIKAWIGSSDVKDKSTLIDSRKLIETKMEQFKICEKDTKTKAYSKEGLARDSKLDPKDQEREEKRDWINQCIERLAELVDTIQLEVEKISGGRGKNKNKKEIDMLENRIKKNKWHSARLEQILRLLDAEDLDPSLLDAIKDDVDYYIESAVDDDGVLGIEDEFDIYEDLQLDSISRTGGGLSEAKEEVDADTSSTSEVVSSVTDDKGVDDAESGKKSTVPTSQLISSLGKQIRAQPSKQSPVTSSPPPKPLSGNSTAPVASIPQHLKPSVVQPVQPQISSKKSIEKGAVPVSVEDPSKVRDDKTIKSENQPSIWGNSTTPRMPQQTSGVDMTTPAQFSQPSASSVYSSNNVAPPVGGQQQILQHQSMGSQSMGLVPAPSNMGQSFVAHQASTFPAASSSMGGSVFSGNGYRQGLSPEVMSSLVALKHSMHYTPLGNEVERTQSYTPKNPYKTHAAFPIHTASVIENPILFEKLPTDSLFLAFYYQQGSHQQYLAAKQLKKQSWRYHKKYMTWFQRHDEPKTTTEEFEEGTYVYFDYESGWCPRLKSEFKFEYCYLEDDISKP